MTTLLHCGLENAAVATVLAVTVGLFGLLFRRHPALIHVLWLIVLVKLITPPAWKVALPTPMIPQWNSSEHIEPVSTARLQDSEVAYLTSLEEVDLVLGATPDVAENTEAVVQIPESIESEDARGRLWYTGRWQQALAGLAGCIWVAGSVVTLVVMAVRIRRFRRAIDLAKPAPDHLLDFVERVAARLDLPFLPEVCLVPGPVSPMIWALGRDPLLILPSELWPRLDNRQREALVAHELAHLKRGDHRVRMLELAVTVIYWWLPVIWWVRRALRQVEEQCCDAWVVWAFPGASRAYAETLIETVDFLSGVPDPVPMAASGFGHASQLRRRLVMIMNGTTPRLLSRAGHLPAIGLAFAFLPFSPSSAETPDEKDQTKQDIVVKVVDAVKAEPKVVEDQVVTVFTLADDSQVQAEAKAAQEAVVRFTNDVVLQARDEESAAKVQAEQARAKAVEARVKAVDELIATIDNTEIDTIDEVGDGDGKKVQRVIVRGRVKADEDAKTDRKTETGKPSDPKSKARLDELAAEVKARAAEVKEAGQRLADAQKHLTEAKVKFSQNQATFTDNVRIRTARVQQDNSVPRIVELRRSEGGPAALTLRGPQGSIRKEAAEEHERRLSDVEKKLDKILKQLAELKSSNAK